MITTDTSCVNQRNTESKEETFYPYFDKIIFHDTPNYVETPITRESFLTDNENYNPYGSCLLEVVLPNPPENTGNCHPSNLIYTEKEPLSCGGLPPRVSCPQSPHCHCGALLPYPGPRLCTSSREFAPGHLPVGGARRKREEESVYRGRPSKE